MNKNTYVTNLNGKWSETIQEIHNWNSNRKGWKKYQSSPHLEAHGAEKFEKLRKGVGRSPTQLQANVTGLE